MPVLNYNRLVQCGECGHWLLPENLPEHCRKYHSGEGVKLPPMKRKGGSGSITKTCRICHQPIQRDHLSRHLETIHHVHSVPANLQVPQFTRCSICEAQILSKNIQKHLRKVHHQKSGYHANTAPP